MIRSVYQTAMSMLVQQKKQETHAHNLANVETAGFKAQSVVAEASFSEVFVNHAASGRGGTVVLGSMPMGVRVSGLETAWTQGPLIETGNPLDLALEGEGFLSFESPQGILYSRHGQLHENQAGEWVDRSGFRLRWITPEGNAEVLKNITGEALSVRASGEVINPSGEILGRIPVYRAGNEGNQGNQGLELLDHGYVRIPAPRLEIAQGTGLKQAVKEGANVDSTSSMIDMMATGRLLQTQQRILSTLDETLNRAVNEIGKV